MQDPLPMAASPFGSLPVASYGGGVTQGLAMPFAPVDTFSAGAAHTSVPPTHILVQQPPAEMARIVAPSLPFLGARAPPTAEERAAVIAKHLSGDAWKQSHKAPVSVSRPQPVPTPFSMIHGVLPNNPVTTRNYVSKTDLHYQRSPEESTAEEAARSLVHSQADLPTDWQIPNVQMTLRGQKVTLHEALHNRRGIIFGVPGAFSPICSQKHVPGFCSSMPILRKAVEYVACVAVNDPYVLKAWAQDLNVPTDIVMISDWEGKFTEALGLELDASIYHMGVRCRRFCILVSQGTIMWFGLENDAFVDRVALILHRLHLLDDSQLKSIEAVAMSLEKSNKLESPGLTEDGRKRLSETQEAEPRGGAVGQQELEVEEEEDSNEETRHLTEDDEDSEASFPPHREDFDSGKRSKSSSMDEVPEDELSENEDEDELTTEGEM